MRPQVVSLGAVAISPSLIMDRYAGVVNIGIGVVVSGTATFSVQYTYDNLNDPAVTPTWWNFTALNAKTASTDSNINFPISAVRLNVTAWTSGTVTMTVIQAKQGPGSH